MKALQRFLAAFIAVMAFSANVYAQSGCTLASLTTTQGWSTLPSKIAFDADASNVSKSEIESARDAWTTSPHCANSLPDMKVWDSTQNPLKGDTEKWVIRRDTYDSFINGATDPTVRQKLQLHKTGADCAGIIVEAGTIYIFRNAPATSNCRNNIEHMTHEFGHTVRLEDATPVQDLGGQICAGSIMANQSPRSITAETCRDAKREFDKVVDCSVASNANHPDCWTPPIACFGEDCGGRPDPDEDDCTGNPGPNCPPDCTTNPGHPDCGTDCTINPTHPDCQPLFSCGPETMWVDLNRNGRVDPNECIPIPYSPIPDGGGRRKGTVTVNKTATSGDTFVLRLNNRSSVSLSLTGMSRDFDCHVVLNSGGPDTGQPAPASASGGSTTGTTTSLPCSVNAGTTDDSWAGVLDVGYHTIQVWPFGTGTGDFTLTATVTELADGVTPTAPSPPANPVRTLPFTVSNTVEAGADDQTYTFKTPESGTVTVSLTGLSTDFDCYVNTRSGNRCSNNYGTDDDSWSGTLAAGTHHVYVYAWQDDAGSYTVSVDGPPAPTPPSDPPTTTPDPEPDPDPTPDPDPDPDPDPNPDPDPTPEPADLPTAPTLTGRVNVTNQILTWTAPTSSSDITRYQLETKAPDGNWHFPSGGSGTGSNLSATTLTWNIVTPHSIVRAYRVRATNSDGDGPWSNEITLTSVDPPDPPEQVSITGNVSRQTQTVSWTAPQSDEAITKYQLQTRESATRDWRWPNSGSPTASNVPATARSWSVTTPAGLHRHYRVRAVSSAGDGAWSSHVELTSETPPPPDPLSVPDIPDFPRLPSGGTVNTTFPGATGGVSPYTYSVSGLPPGVTFNASTRTATGTLPVVSSNTTYNGTYTVTDSASATASDSFSATVLPPAEPGAPSLTGSVNVTNQSLGWTAPTSSVPITGYQLQVRNSSSSSWRCTSAGSPSPSCSLSSSTTGWSVTTPSGMTRHYRVRASNAGGDGAWSNEVILTSDT